MEAAAPEASKAKAMFMAKKEKIAKEVVDATVDKRALAKQFARAALPRNHYTDAEPIAGAAAEANPNRHRGASALVLAAKARDPAMLRALLALGADPNARAFQSGFTPLMEAAYVTAGDGVWEAIAARDRTSDVRGITAAELQA